MEDSSEEVKYFRQQKIYNILQPYCGQISAHVLECISLRVLQCGSIEELSPSIDHLKYLRYLNLSEGAFETLPESLCKLWNLQILKLDGCKDLRELPDSLIQMKALQKLSLNDCYSLSSLPAQIGKLSSLRSLTTYFVGKERGFLLAELGALNLKGDLEIRHLERVKRVEDAKEANMSSKQLKELTLSWESDEDTELEENELWELQGNVEEILEVLQPDTQQLESLVVYEYKGARFPQWVFCPSLTNLTIEGCTEVKGLDEALQHMTALKVLTLENLPNLESLPDCFGNLPLLYQLHIMECYELRCLPTSLRLSNLQQLTISGGSDELEKRCEKETGEDWPIIAHIPFIVAKTLWC